MKMYIFVRDELALGSAMVACSPRLPRWLSFLQGHTRGERMAL